VVKKLAILVDVLFKVASGAEREVAQKLTEFKEVTRQTLFSVNMM
jgi:hypothetical protein